MCYNGRSKVKGRGRTPNMYMYNIIHLTPTYIHILHLQLKHLPTTLNIYWVSVHEQMCVTTITSRLAFSVSIKEETDNCPNSCWNYGESLWIGYHYSASALWWFSVTIVSRGLMKIMGTDTLTDVTVAEHQFTGTDIKRVHIYLYMYICVTLTPCIKGLPGNYNTTDNEAYTVHICGLTLYSVYIICTYQPW